MFRKKYYTGVLLLLLTTATPLAAQDNATAIKSFLQKVQQAYGNASRLGFRIKYLYANAGQPGKYIDSLNGEMQMDKDRCRFVIDGTETVVTAKYTISISADTRVIYLGPAKRNTMMDPAGILDSVIAHLNGVHAQRTTQANAEWLTLDFPPGQAYTHIHMAIDPRTGLLQQITYDLHTAGWIGEEQIDRPGHPAPYQQEGHVSIIFSHYLRGAFDEALFNEGNFFTKTDGVYTPAGKYKDYNIFLGSPNL